MGNNDKSKYFKTFCIFNFVAYYIFSFVNGKIDFRIWTEEYRIYFVFYGILVGALAAIFHYIDDNWNPGV